jgi:hypothetical protein
MANNMLHRKVPRERPRWYDILMPNTNRIAIGGRLGIRAGEAFMPSALAALADADDGCHSVAARPLQYDGLMPSAIVLLG